MLNGVQYRVQYTIQYRWDPHSAVLNSADLAIVRLMNCDDLNYLSAILIVTSGHNLPNKKKTLLVKVAAAFVWSLDGQTLKTKFDVTINIAICQ